MYAPRRPDEPEILTTEERQKLEASLAAIGPWAYLSGLGGIHRAERLGSQRHEQAALTADELIEAVRRREAQLAPAVPVHTGLSYEP